MFKNVKLDVQTKKNLKYSSYNKQHKALENELIALENDMILNLYLK